MFISYQLRAGSFRPGMYIILIYLVVCYLLLYNVTKYYFAQVEITPCCERLCGVPDPLRG
jgi:hypothetical protein